MNFILYSSLVTKCNQISQNVDTTAHCPITLRSKVTFFIASIQVAKNYTMGKCGQWQNIG